MVSALNFSAAAVIINCVLTILIDVYGCAYCLQHVLIACNMCWERLS